MNRSKKESFFWTSYSDLMTSLFFIMLVLFVLVIVLLHNKIKDQGVKLSEFEKIEEIKKAINNIDTSYFEYNEVYKKHILKIRANFEKNRFEERYIDQRTRKSLVNAGKSIKNFIKTISSKNDKIQYLLIIEGQASRDSADKMYNYVLSYERAYTLNEIWSREGIDFGENCEVLISGSGVGGTIRDKLNERRNQRFLIHIIPKTGVIEQVKK